MEKSPEAFRTISELAELLETPAHVLRFWESRFPQIKPVKRAGGRRYYRPADVALIAGIRRLLHDEGLTIRGVQKMLREQGVRHVAAFAADGFLDPAAFDAADPPAPDPEPAAEVVALAQWREQRKEADPAASGTAQPSLFDAGGDSVADSATDGPTDGAAAPEAPEALPPADALPEPPQEPATATPEDTRDVAPPVDQADHPAPPAAAESAQAESPPESPGPAEPPPLRWLPPEIRRLPRGLPPARHAALTAVFQRLLALRARLDEGQGSGLR